MAIILRDRGPHIADVVRPVEGMVAAVTAICLRGNHDDRAMRWMQGCDIHIAHRHGRGGLGATRSGSRHPVQSGTAKWRWTLSKRLIEQSTAHEGEQLSAEGLRRPTDGEDRVLMRKHPAKAAGGLGRVAVAGEMRSGSLLGGLGLSGGLPVPGQQGVDLVHGMIGDAGEHIGEPGLGIDAGELCGLDHRVQDRRAVAAESEPQKVQFRLPTAIPRSARSATRGEP
jgi:hypothetical protein